MSILQVYNWSDFIQSIFYPARCLLCGAKGHAGRELCLECGQTLPYNRHACAICALPLPSTAPVGTLCGPCSQNTPHYDRCYSALEYDDLTGSLITQLKFNNRLNHARLLSQLLIDHLEQHPFSLPDLIAPVPLHRQRLRERGFNQALEIARPISKHFSLPLIADLCTRTKITSTQLGLNRKQRQKNLHNAFHLTQNVTGKHIVLIDDVVTTGSTIAELARILKKAGARRVDAWSVARTPLIR